MKTRTTMPKIRIAFAVGLCLAALPALAATNYVWQGSPSPGPPFTNWATAAHTIQEAVDTASTGDTVLVTNGVFAPISVTKVITLLSANGPTATTINGGRTNRCVWFGTNALISGFTLTNGSAGEGGGVWCASTMAVITNCILTANFARDYGGGAYRGTLYKCILSGNTGTEYPSGCGGGGYSSILHDCTLIGNLARYGGGASGATLYNCVLTGNHAHPYGLGAPGGGPGGGAHKSTLYNCTLTGNSADYGGGTYGSTLYNCIVYYNTARDGSNYLWSTFAYSCTTPWPGGEGNIDAEPVLLSDLHLAAPSPCIGAGNSAYATGVDMDGEAWLDPPCMGADEYSLRGLPGSLRVFISANCTITGPGWPLGFGAQIQGRSTALSWDFSDGVVVSNQTSVSHTWSAPGTYLVTLTGWNGDSSGSTATTRVQVLPVVQCVSASSVSPQPPYTNWATAAATIQDAVDAAAPGGVVLVSNGSYASGGAVVAGQANRVVLSKRLTVLSLNGPRVTTISGDAGTRCVFLDAAATLSGFTLANGRAALGGGVMAETSGGVVTNCVLHGNTALAGGGAYYATLLHCILRENRAEDSGAGACASALRNCLLVGNVAAMWGGGADGCTLEQCTVVGNSAPWGGGVCESVLQNCIVYDNTGVDDPNHAASSIEYSCTVPLPPGVGNISNAPAFLSSAAGDFRLCATSGCIDGGRDLGGLIGTDLLGYSRPLDGNGDGVAAFDMGAYEYSGPPADSNADGIPDGWCCRHGLDPLDAAVGSADPDQDGHTTYQEWAADTDPKNPVSRLRVCGFSPGPSRSILVLSSPNRHYTLQSCTELAAPVWTAVPGATDIAGTGGLLTLTDPAPSVPRFYRVSVRVP